MGSQRNTGAFIAGSVIGGVIGAAVALWKTPQSGPELRASLSGGERDGAVTYRTEPGGTGVANRRFSSPVLGFVEKVTAPIVGVELGKLAKDDPQAYTSPARSSSADARPPGSAEVTEPLGAVGRATSDEFPAATPADEVTHDPVEGSVAHAATADELTTPRQEYVEELAEEHKGAQPGAVRDFSFENAPEGDETR
jgi:hypothetical protein